MTAPLITKIRKFKITPKSQGILRHLKNFYGVKPTDDLEKIVDRAAADTQKIFTPAAVYATYPSDPQAFPPSFTAWPEGAMDLSLCAVTLGAALEEECRKLQARDEALHVQILESLGQDALNQAVQFLHRLIEEQARTEESEFDTPERIEGERMAPALTALEADRAGITVHDGNLNPRFSCVFSIAWKPATRKSKKPSSETVRVAR